MLLVTDPQKFRASLGVNIIASRISPREFRRMIDSVATISDQIVIVFDHRAPPVLYSIGQEYNADIYYRPWSYDFALQRNVALAATWTDYVFWIDTDEYIRRDVAMRIRSLMRDTRGKAYYVWQGSPTGDGKFILVPQVRIFPNLPAVEWEIPIHEQNLPSLVRAGVRTQVTDLRVEHTGYWSEGLVKAKNLRNLEILRTRVNQVPGDAFSRRNYQNAIAYERL